MHHSSLSQCRWVDNKKVKGNSKILTKTDRISCQLPPARQSAERPRQLTQMMLSLLPRRQRLALYPRPPPPPQSRNVEVSRGEGGVTERSDQAASTEPASEVGEAFEIAAPTPVAQDSSAEVVSTLFLINVRFPVLFSVPQEQRSFTSFTRPTVMVKPAPWSPRPLHNKKRMHGREYASRTYRHLSPTYLNNPSSQGLGGQVPFDNRLRTLEQMVGSPVHSAGSDANASMSPLASPVSPVDDYRTPSVTLLTLCHIP